MSLPERKETTNIGKLNIKTNAPNQLIQSKNYNECNFLISMLSEYCTLGELVRNVEPPALPATLVPPVSLAPPVTLVPPAKEKQTCEDISLILERCILDGHNCKTFLHKFNVLCKGDVDTKL
jgi:hypothetical protein